MCVEINAEELRELQKADDTLKDAREAADAKEEVKSGEQTIRFVWR